MVRYWNTFCLCGRISSNTTSKKVFEQTRNWDQELQMLIHPLWVLTSCHLKKTPCQLLFYPYFISQAWMFSLHMGTKLLYAKCGTAATKGNSSSFYTTNILNLLFCIFDHVQKHNCRAKVNSKSVQARCPRDYFYTLSWKNNQVVNVILTCGES